MKSKDVLIRIMKRSDKERGIRVMGPDANLSEGHIKKADHNLVVMTDMQRLGHEDWVAITAYYAMYHSAMSLLVRIGLESKDHAATAAALDYFFGKDVSIELLKKFHAARERKDNVSRLAIESRYINKLWKAKREREKAQYGVSMSIGDVGSMAKDARDFASRMKLVIAEMDEKIAEGLVKKVGELKNAS